MRLRSASVPRRVAPRAVARVLAAGAVLVGLVAPLGAATASVTGPALTLRPAAAVPLPPTPSGLPTGIEDLAGYVGANSCDPHAKPGATELGDLLVATYPTTSYGIDRTCGTDPRPTSEHYDGRALDWMVKQSVPAERARTDAVLSWLLSRDGAGNPYANARRLGVMYLIWNNRIWGSYRAAEGWRPYSDCATATSSADDTRCHRDHLHVSLSWEGAMGRTSYWTDQVAARDYGPCRVADLNWAAPYRAARATPCPTYAYVSAPADASSLLRTLTTYSGMVLRRGDTGPVVRAVQQAVGASADGTYAAATRTAVSGWQSRHGLTATGVVDAGTWRALLRANAPAVQVPAHPELTRYKSQRLARGSRGPAVVALQRRLRITADGRFGSVTVVHVKRFQRHHSLRVTGVVNRATWTGLGA